MALFGDRALAESKNRIASLQRDLENVTRTIAEHLADANRAQVEASLERAQKWEYLIRDDIDNVALDQLGRRGWELVNAFSYTTGLGLGGNTTLKVHTRFVFKVPIMRDYPDEARPHLDAAAEAENSKADVEAQLLVAQQEYHEI